MTLSPKTSRSFSWNSWKTNGESRVSAVSYYVSQYKIAWTTSTSVTYWFVTWKYFVGLRQRMRADRKPRNIRSPHISRPISITPAHHCVPAPRSALAPPYFVTRPLTQLSATRPAPSDSRAPLILCSHALVCWKVQTKPRNRENEKGTRKPIRGGATNRLRINIYRVKWRHRVYGHNTIAILWI